jgi:hypothetical protein
MRKKHNLFATILLISSGGCASINDSFDKHTHPPHFFGNSKCKTQCIETPCDGMFFPCNGSKVSAPPSEDSTEMPPIPTLDIETTDMEKSFSDLQAMSSKRKSIEDLKTATKPQSPIVLPIGFFEMIETKPIVKLAE